MIAMLFTIVTAAYDEIHQTFIPSRTGRWQDVVIDTLRCGGDSDRDLSADQTRVPAATGAGARAGTDDDAIGVGPEGWASSQKSEQQVLRLRVRPPHQTRRKSKGAAAPLRMTKAKEARWNASLNLPLPMRPRSVSRRG